MRFPQFTFCRKLNLTPEKRFPLPAISWITRFPQRAFCWKLNLTPEKAFSTISV